MRLEDRTSSEKARTDQDSLMKSAASLESREQSDARKGTIT
jgi:hypothetical protein